MPTLPPAFILGLNEDGSGISRVYLRSALAQSTISSGIDTTIWDIADGKSMGSINYGQWNHFAITRSGNVFRTFKNGTKQNECEFLSPLFSSLDQGISLADEILIRYNKSWAKDIKQIYSEYSY